MADRVMVRSNVHGRALACVLLILTIAAGALQLAQAIAP